MYLDKHKKIWWQITSNKKFEPVHKFQLKIQPATSRLFQKYGAGLLFRTNYCNRKRPDGRYHCGQHYNHHAKEVGQYRHRSTSLFSTLTHLFSLAKVGVLTKDFALGD